MDLVNILFMIYLFYSVLIGAEPCESSLKRTFHYFLMPLETGDVRIAKILRNSGKIEPQTYIQRKTLHSSETYLILTRIELMTCNLYYWVGTKTSLADRVRAAKYAVQLYSLLEDFHSKTEREFSVHIAREKENMESTSFQLTVSSKNTISKEWTQKQIFYRYYINTEFPSNTPNLILVRGRITSRIKNVPVDPKWLKEDTCLILETGYSVEELLPLSIYCGTDTSSKAQKRVKSIIPSFLIFYADDPVEIIHQNIQRDDLLFKVFVEALENSSFSNVYEVDTSNDHLMDADTFVHYRDQYVKFFEVPSKQTAMVISTKTEKMREMDERPMLSRYFYPAINNYFVDTASITGIIVLFSRYTNLEERVKTIEYAEEYMYRKESTTSIPQCMRIYTFTSFTMSISSMFQFRINLTDFPSVWFSMREEHW